MKSRLVRCTSDQPRAASGTDGSRRPFHYPRLELRVQEPQPHDLFSGFLELETEVVLPEQVIDLLVDTLRKELVRSHDAFVVKMIQVCYDDDRVVYEPVKEEDITRLVCV
jgi:hypothetical protein